MPADRAPALALTAPPAAVPELAQVLTPRLPEPPVAIAFGPRAPARRPTTWVVGTFDNHAGAEL